MANESQKTVTMNLRLSPALYRQLELAANNAERSIESTIRSILWIGLGSLNLRPGRSGYDK